MTFIAISNIRSFVEQETFRNVSWDPRTPKQARNVDTRDPALPCECRLFPISVRFAFINFRTVINSNSGLLVPTQPFPFFLVSVSTLTQLQNLAELVDSATPLWRANEPAVPPSSHRQVYPTDSVWTYPASFH